MSRNIQSQIDLQLQKYSIADNNCKALVIGLGSPHGNDAVGLHVVDGLSRLLPPSVQVTILNEPTRILPFLIENRYVWIVDACRSDQPVGTISRIAWPDKQITRSWSFSGHGIGLAEVLELADIMIADRATIVLYVINIGNAPNEPCRQLSTEVSEALEILRQRLVEEIVASSDPDIFNKY